MLKDRQRAGKAKPRRRLLKVALITFGVLVFSLVGAFAVAWVLTPIPGSTQPQATAQGSVIYYRDGKTVLARQGVNRKRVPLEQVPQHVRNAVIAAENRSFYQDQGISLTGTARAMWSTLTGQQLQGGSTITQQMVRNYYSGLSQERSIVRKLKEIMISLKVDQSKSKDWVLEQYLNTIYFGRNADGIQAAADAYFRKDVSKLTVAEGAYLAAVIQQPSRFADPGGADLDAARSRWRSVVDGMWQTGALTAEQAAATTFPELKRPRPTFAPKGQEGYMLDQVTAELRRRGYTDETVNQGGLKIVSTFDKDLMAAAERAVTSVLPESTPKQVRTGLAAVDPETGEVVAFYGGRDWRKQPYDNAFGAKVQAGSTFKAYTLAAALDNGFGLDTRVDGNSPLRITTDGKGIPNSGGYSYGQINLVKATQSSVNTAFVDLGRKVGLDKVVEAAEKAGIPAGQLAPHSAAAT
ncbi:transglycosylase domain-containing protein, partial [Streptosporangium algeriense]